METLFLVIHLMLAVALIGIIMLQRSEGGLGGLGGGAGSGLMTARGTANFLTRTTTILATGFMITSICLALMATNRTSAGSIADQIKMEVPAETAPAQSTTTPEGETPSAPLPK